MAHSRSYQKSRHYDDESNRRPTPRIAEMLATFEGNDEVPDDESIESDLVFPSGRSLRFYLTPRKLSDLHQNLRQSCGNDDWLYERTLLYNAIPEPWYAYA